jgi:hypothetical protein
MTQPFALLPQRRTPDHEGPQYLRLWPALHAPALLALQQGALH